MSAFRSDPVAEIREEIAELRGSVGEHSLELVAIHGADGRNGKIGRLSGELDASRALVRKAIAALCGSIVVALLAIYNAGRERGETEQRIRVLEVGAADLKATIAELWRVVYHVPAATSQPANGGSAP